LASAAATNLGLVADTPVKVRLVGSLASDAGRV